MIVVDFNQVAISNMMAELGGRRDVEVNLPLIRHMIINSIRSYKRKFGAEFGEIVIDSKCRTNIKGIYAAGDVTTVPFKQIIIAMGEGAKAALTAFEELVVG